jgi:hypothetical protein
MIQSKPQRFEINPLRLGVKGSFNDRFQCQNACFCDATPYFSEIHVRRRNEKPPAMAGN